MKKTRSWLGFIPKKSKPWGVEKLPGFDEAVAETRKVLEMGKHLANYKESMSPEQFETLLAGMGGKRELALKAMSLAGREIKVDSGAELIRAMIDLGVIE